MLFLRQADVADRPVRTLRMTLAYAGCKLKPQQIPGAVVTGCTGKTLECGNVGLCDWGYAGTRESSNVGL